MYSALVKRTGRLAVVAFKHNRSSGQIACLSTAATDVKPRQYETLAISVPKPFVYHVEFNRPQKLNSFSKKMWIEIGQCFESLEDDSDCRIIVVSGAGKLFCAGIDLGGMTELASEIAQHEDIARKAFIFRTACKLYQDSISSLEKCRKPVICAVHSACVGAGVDFITAADIRVCTEDAWFQVKEVDIGMAADVGTLQRLPKVIGSDSLVRELCYSARKLPAKEAKDCGLVSTVYPDKESMVKAALDLAGQIALKSPVAVQGTKMNLVYSRDHTAQEGLDHICAYNMAMLQSEDFLNAVMAQATKQPPPTFAKL